MNIKELQADAAQTQRDKGFAEGFHVAEKLALIHSEVSEALECYRDAGGVADLVVTTYVNGGKPEGFMSELADVVIRCAGLADLIGGDLQASIIEKLAYNKTRPYRHGRKSNG